jgi:hypothetical protein
MKSRTKTYTGYVYYLGGVVSVLGKIEAEFGVNTSPAQLAVLHVKAAMRDKWVRAQRRGSRGRIGTKISRSKRRKRSAT